jgi:hypothetical protein
MVKAPALLLLSLALAGCAVAPQARLSSDTTLAPARYAWDGVGEDPNQPRRTAEPSRSARTAARSIPAQDGTEPDQDAQLNQSLVICNGCLRPQPTADARLAKAAD